MAIRGESKRNALMAMARQEDGTVMLSAAKHLSAHRTRPFAACPIPGLMDICLREIGLP